MLLFLISVVICYIEAHGRSLSQAHSHTTCGVGSLELCGTVLSSGLVSTRVVLSTLYVVGVRARQG